MGDIELKLSSWRTRVRFLRRLAGVFSVLVILLAAGVLVFGWIFGFSAALRLDPNLAGMAVSTSVGLLGCALCILSDTVFPPALRPGLRRRFHGPVALFLLGIALADLIVLSFSPGRGLDQVLFDFAGRRGNIYMSPATAICLALAAGCLLAARYGGRFVGGNLYGVLALSGLFLTVLALTGYAFDSAALYEVFAYSAMALHTAAGFFLVFLGLLLSRPSAGWMRVVVGPGAGSGTLRRTLPFVIVGPFVFCGLTLFAVDAGLINANFRLSILAISAAAGLSVLLFWSALRENADARHLVETNRQLRQALSDRDILLKEVYHRVKNNLQFIDAMLALECEDRVTGEVVAGESIQHELANRLDRVRARVHALGLVHQHLIAARDLATLNLKGFLDELCANQAKGAGFDKRALRVETKIAPIKVDLDRAIPIGLMVTELLSNAAKHGFPDGRAGSILVSAAPLSENAISLSISDDGVGGDSAIAGSAGIEEFAEGEGRVGSMILRSLAAQLGAVMNIDDRNGMRVELTIPLTTV